MGMTTSGCWPAASAAGPMGGVQEAAPWRGRRRAAVRGQGAAAWGGVWGCCVEAGGSTGWAGPGPGQPVSGLQSSESLLPSLRLLGTPACLPACPPTRLCCGAAGMMPAAGSALEADLEGGGGPGRRVRRNRRRGANVDRDLEVLGGWVASPNSFFAQRRVPSLQGILSPSARHCP